MNRQILLVEPNYKNKYPPMGLMKISTYYKRLGDHVTFFKGDLKDLVLDDTLLFCFFVFSITSPPNSIFVLS